MSIHSIRRSLAVALVLALAAAGSAFAQLQSGNLYGTTVDEQGSAVPGVTVTLSGGGAPAVQVTDAQGKFRFVSLTPDAYSLKAELEGFSTVEYPSIQVNIGRSTDIELTMSSASISQVITVTGEAPLLDAHKIQSGATVAQTELEKIPTARDPWAILQSTPGVLTDRINVGGNESGQQSQTNSGSQSSWAVDGVVITDMAALGSSPAYYDFDSFEEMQVSTGGSDATLVVPGVSLNMVTKRGTNEWRGSGRLLAGCGKTGEDHSSFCFGNQQSSSGFDNSDLGRNYDNTAGNPQPQTAFKQGNRIQSVEDYGLEVGGPIVKDRLWVWGSYGKQDIDLLTIADVRDHTILDTKNLKLNAQFGASNSATAFALDSDKIKIGRNAGPTRPQETTWNQSKFGDTPTAYKVEDTHIFSPAFYLTGLYSKVNGGFQLVPQGGASTSAPNARLDGNFIWRDNFLLYQTERPQEQFKADGSGFFNTGNLSHELKFGAGHREAEVSSLSRWPGFGLQLDYYTNYGYNYNIIGLTRAGFAAIKQEYDSAYAQDTLTVGNLTVNAGLRYDKQGGENLARTVAANPAFPNILPAVAFGGGDIGFEWETISPRLGLTYALGAERKTLLRASYSRFADQLGAGSGYTLNPLYSATYAYFYFNDANGNRQAQPGEVITAGGPLFVSGNFDRRNGGLLQSNRVDPDMNAPITDSLSVGIEHALLPEFVVGLGVSYSKSTDLLENELLVFDGDAYSLANLGLQGRPHQRSDYVPTPVTRLLPNGQSRTITFYGLRPGVTTRGGALLENGDRETESLGVSATFYKRLANRWMMRGHVTYQDPQYNVPDSELEDPTPFLGRAHDGDPVLLGSGTGSGSKGGVYINSTWSSSINGMYQIAPDAPWGFNAALNITAREGYPIPYFTRVGRSNIPGSANVQLVDNDEFRHDDIFVIDARVEKEFNFSDFGVTLGVDCFNLLNEGTVMQRIHRLTRSNSNHVQEVLSPRIIRLGARISFR